MNEQPGSPRAGRAMAIGIVVAVLAAIAVIGGIGYHHATRNRRKHGDKVLPGAELYALYCDRCHGPDGTGVAPYPALSRPLSPEEFKSQVQVGKDKMPAFAATFRDEEYPRLYEFVSQLRTARR